MKISNGLTYVQQGAAGSRDKEQTVSTENIIEKEIIRLQTDKKKT
jgi:hypothetical protein